jgi:membrane-associated phospholipid phosphatase
VIEISYYWLLILSLFHVLFFFSSLYVFFPNKKITWSITHIVGLFIQQKKYLLIIVLVAFVHLIQVNVINEYAASLITVDYSFIVSTFDFGIGETITNYGTAALLYFFVFMYIVVYPFILWFSVLFFVLHNDSKSLQLFSSSLAVIYAVALPFYLFFPVTNVYTFYSYDSALELVIPSINNFFYFTTTTTNCFPSLHVAVSLLIALCVSTKYYKRYSYFVMFCALCVMISVIYLAIHWIIDVVGGILLSFGGFYLIKIINWRKP